MREDHVQLAEQQQPALVNDALAALRSDHLAEPRTREEAGFMREGVLRTLRSSIPAPDAIWR